MSEHTPDITTGFIQMVEAFKAKPELEATIADLKRQLEDRETRLNELHDRVNDRESQLASASADKERLTRERDEAMFRTLELEEKTSAVNDLLAQLTRVVHPEPVAKDTNEDQSGAGSKDSVKQDYHAEQRADKPYEGTAYDGGFQGLPPSSGSNVESFPRPEYSGQASVQDRAEGSGGLQGKSDAPNWDSPSKEQQNSSETSGYASEPMASSDVKDEPNRPNEGKPYSDKPYWVSDANWRNEGGQGPYDGGSWTAPWANRYGS